MISGWSLKKKIGVFTLVAIVYVYCIVMIKTSYTKTQRLHRIADRVGRTEKLMDSVKMAEYKFAQNIEELSSYLCEDDITSPPICDGSMDTSSTV